VVNFPSGEEALEKVVSDTKAAVEDGADEVDLVINYRLLKENAAQGKQAAQILTRAVRDVCPEGQVLLKVIIESGELQSPELITAACEAAMEGGCDFVKTSTGKVKVNATLESAEIMLRAVAKRRKEHPNERIVGFKAAGGVRDLEQTQAFLGLAADILCGNKLKWAEVNSRLFRFGASSLLGALRSPVSKKRKADDEFSVEGKDSKLAMHAISLIDHTSLGLQDTEEGIRSLVDAAVAEQPHTAAVCIYPKFIKLVRSMQAASAEQYPRTLRVATVVNFPSGEEALEKVVSDTKAAVEDGADEVDLVINYRLLKENAAQGKQAAQILTRAVRDVCPEGQVLLKVIIESGELQSPELITAACEAAMEGGCDFVKTSTGKVKVNATLESAEIMLRAVAKRRASDSSSHVVGFKAAGGVRDLPQSTAFLELAATILLGSNDKWPQVDSRLFRFGASSLLSSLRLASSKRQKTEQKANQDQSAY